MKPIVSFITGVKNHSLELKEMIQSLINQDMVEWESVIVDDHSQEPIKETIEHFNDDRIFYYLLGDGLTGISNARNLAVSKTNTDIVLTADGDDISRPQRARRTYEIMSKSNCDAFYSNLEYFISENDKKWMVPFQPFNEKLFRMFNFMTNPGTAFRKDKFQEAGGYDPAFILSEDYDLWLRILNNGGKFCFTDEILVNYRRSPESVSIKKIDLMHDYIQKTRIKNGIPPFDIAEVKNCVVPEIGENLLSEKGRKIWEDDRYIKSHPEI